MDVSPDEGKLCNFGRGRRLIDCVMDTCREPFPITTTTPTTTIMIKMMMIMIIIIIIIIIIILVLSLIASYG